MGNRPAIRAGLAALLLAMPLGAAAQDLTTPDWLSDSIIAPHGNIASSAIPAPITTMPLGAARLDAVGLLPSSVTGAAIEPLGRQRNGRACAPVPRRPARRPARDAGLHRNAGPGGTGRTRRCRTGSPGCFSPGLTCCWRAARWSPRAPWPNARARRTRSFSGGSLTSAC